MRFSILLDEFEVFVIKRQHDDLDVDAIHIFFGDCCAEHARIRVTLSAKIFFWVQALIWLAMKWICFWIHYLFSRNPSPMIKHCAMSQCESIGPEHVSPIMTTP